MVPNLLNNFVYTRVDFVDQVNTNVSNLKISINMIPFFVGIQFSYICISSPSFLVRKKLVTSRKTQQHRVDKFSI